MRFGFCEPGDQFLHFCLISIFYPPYSFGGDSIYLYRLATELVRRGHQVDVIHCSDSFHLLQSQVDPSAFPVTEGVTVHRLESGMGSLGPLLAHQTGRPLTTGARIAEILESKRFDVVHYHNISLFGPGVLEIEPSYAPPKLYTAHDHWLVCPMSVLWKNRSRVCDRPTCISCTVRSGRPPQWWRYSGLLPRAARHVDQFLSPSRFTARMHRERGFESDFEVLNYFLDPVEELTRDSAPPPHERPYYLFVGRLEKYKGVQDLIEAFRGPGEYDLVIVGSGAYEKALRAQADGCERIRFDGWVSQENLGPYYANALAVLAPSVTYETFGIIVIEANARGIPVIVRDLGPLPEIIEDGGGGVIFGDQAELVQRMETLYRDTEFRLGLGRQGRKAFLEKWTPDAHVERYFALIERARLRRRARGSS
ncbi:MAG: glycosyltransferase family 4 protein [Bryobacterales bacterium]